ncbi:hypothetical protein Tco_0122115 [Tanacetum coccineum]
MATNEETNAAGTDTRPPMLVENDYESWKIRIHRYIRGKPNGKLIWKSIQNGPTPHPMVTDPPPANSTVMPAPRKKLDSEFNDEENKLEMADTQAEINLSQGLPRHIFNILNQTSTAKEIWDNDLADSYLDEIVCLKNANKVARDMLQRFNMPTHTIPMLSKKPKAATADLHKDLLGTLPRWSRLYGQGSCSACFCIIADTLFASLLTPPFSIWDSEEVLVHQVVSMKKMNEKPGHVRPENGFYEKLNALKFVPQQELSREQAYWLPANEIASNAC